MSSFFFLPLFAEDVKHQLPLINEDTNKSDKNSAEEKRNQAAAKIRSLRLSVPTMGKIVFELEKQKRDTLKEQDFVKLLDSIAELSPDQKSALRENFKSLGLQDFKSLTTSLLGELAASEPVKKEPVVAEPAATKDETLLKRLAEEQKAEQEAQKKFQEELKSSLKELLDKKKKEQEQQRQGRPEAPPERGGGAPQGNAQGSTGQGNTGGDPGSSQGQPNQEQRNNRSRNAKDSFHDEDKKKNVASRNSSTSDKAESDSKNKDDKESNSKRSSSAESISGLLEKINAQKEKDSSSKKEDAESKPNANKKEPGSSTPVDANAKVAEMIGPARADLGNRSGLPSLASTSPIMNDLSQALAGGSGSSASNSSLPNLNGSSSPPGMSGVSGGAGFLDGLLDEGPAMPQGAYSAGIADFIKGNIYSDAGGSFGSSSSTASPSKDEGPLTDEELANGKKEAPSTYYWDQVINPATMSRARSQGPQNLMQFVGGGKLLEMACKTKGTCPM